MELFEEVGDTIGTRDAPGTAEFRDEVKSFAYWTSAFVIEAWPEGKGGPVFCDPEKALAALESRHARLPFEADTARRLAARNPKDRQTDAT